MEQETGVWGKDFISFSLKKGIFNILGSCSGFSSVKGYKNSFDFKEIDRNFIFLGTKLGFSLLNNHLSNPRETNLLYDPAESSTANKQRVAVVVSHELAHQWFGNLVTLEWWDDLW